MSKRGLGKGLDALFSLYSASEDESFVEDIQGKINSNKIIEIEISRVDVNPNQPRKIFNEDGLKELSESIKQYGVIQPIIVASVDERFMVIAGERRLRASKLANLLKIPCIVKDYSERQIKEVALIENLQREDLNPIEAAKAIRQLMEEYKLTQEAISDNIGKSRPSVANLLRLLNLNHEVLKLIEQNQISAGHARVLVALNDENMQIGLAQRVVEKQMSVRELENLVKSINKSKDRAGSVQEENLELEEFVEEMQKIFATKVIINGNDKKGKIVIEYFSNDDLERIYELIKLINSKKLTLQNLSEFNRKN